MPTIFESGMGAFELDALSSQPPSLALSMFGILKRPNFGVDRIAGSSWRCSVSQATSDLWKG